MRPKCLLATNNLGKLQEIRALLQDIPFTFVTPREMGILIDVEETGVTYEANATLKATTFMKYSRLITLSDDSGLEVKALDGEPGIRSARFAGINTTDRERIAHLLAKLKKVPLEKRQARFVCTIAIAEPDGNIHVCQGVCEGLISEKPSGSMGHGYDPVFYVPDYKKTMGELPMEIKNRISHRGQAIRKAKEILLSIAARSGN